MYSIMDNSNISWNCLKCGLPNFSSTFFSQSIPSSLSANFFSVLSCNSPGEPFATSSPKSIHSHSSLYHHNSTTHHGYHTNRKCKTVNRPLRIISLNFQSIKNKKPELDLLLDTTKPDVIIGTETWLDSSISSSEYFPAGRYNVYRRDRPPNSKGQSHGGVLIAINSEFDSTEVNSLQTDCEIVWVELTIQNSRKLLLSSFYRPQPNDDVSLEKLNQSLKRLNPNSKSIIIVSGDFNLGHIDWTSSSIIPGKPNVKQHQDILDIIADHSLTQIVDKPTRNDKTLDLIITNYPSIVDNFETIPPIGEADHDILSLEITVSLRRCKHKPRQVLKYSKANWDNIKQDLKTIYHKINQSQDSQDIDSMWNLFKDGLQMSISKNIPSKTTKYDNKLPWISDELRKKMNKYRRKLRKRQSKQKPKSEELKKLKREIQKEQRQGYWRYIENMIFDIPIPDQESNRFTKYPKNLFSYIKTQKTESQTTPPLRSNGILKADARSKAEILNNQFQKSFTPDNADPIPDKGQSPHRLMQNINITETGIKKLLNNLKPHKAAGPDKIPSRILKECSEVISPILLIIFRKSLSCGKIPSEWKHANICPVYKKGDKHDPINYRPISLTCICCKLLEHIISSNVMSHLENNNILYDLQHGFRPSRSCETQLISFLQHVSQSNNQNIQTDVVIMDFAKAFDKVPHQHLLYKLKYYGISCNAYDWISDFLTDRTQTVVLEGEMSSKAPVTSGVPQGTVLGPILFLIYINDFPEYLQHSTLRLFADDSIIYKEIKTINDAQNLQLDLDAACRWEKDWLMHFHPDKCNVISITQKRKPIHFTYKLHDHPLAKVEHSKYLGITLQSNLKWNKHINSITNKANQSLGFLKRNLKIKSSAVKSHAYKAFVRPKLEYASAVWDPHTRTQINQIEKVQRRAARYVTNRYHNTSSVTDMLQNLNWPSLEIRRTRVRLIMFYKIIHHVVAIHPLDTLLLPTTTITRYNSSHTYQHIRTDKDSYKYSFYPRTIIQWNILPIHVHEAVTVDAFKALVPVTVLAPIYHV